MLECGVRVLGDRAPVRRALQVELGEPLPRGVSDEARAAGRLLHGREPGVVHRCPPDVGEAHDVGLTGGQGQHPLAGAADEQRRVRPLHREGQAGVAADPDLLALQVDGLPGEVRLDERDDLLELRDPQRRLLEVQAHGFVLAPVRTRPEAELEPTVGEQVDRRRLLRERGRDVVVDAEHPTTDPQRGGPRRRGGHRGDRGEVLRPQERLVAHRAGAEVVVGEEQRRVAEVLHLAGQVPPLPRRLRRRRLDAEAERSGLSHRCTRRPPAGPPR